MVMKLRFVTVGMIDLVKLRATVNTAIQAMITGGTLLQTTDSGSISLKSAASEDSTDAQ